MNATTSGGSGPDIDTTAAPEQAAPVRLEERGRLTVDDRVVEKVAGYAVTFVTDAAAAPRRVLGVNIGGARPEDAASVEARVDDDIANVQVAVAVRWPRSVQHVADEVRERDPLRGHGHHRSAGGACRRGRGLDDPSRPGRTEGEMTASNWVTRVVCALLALALLLGSLLAIVELVAAALDRAPALVPYPDWTSWLRTHSWDDRVVTGVLVGVVVLGLLLLFLALRRGKPASLALRSRSDGVDVTASRRSVEKSLVAAAARTTGVTGASAAVSRRTARVDARTMGVSEPGIREEVDSAVRERLDSLGLERRMRTRVRVTAKDPR